jgi:hypothetical protein
MSKGGSVTDNSVPGMQGGKVSFISLDEHRIERKDLKLSQMIGGDYRDVSTFSAQKSKFFEKGFTFDYILEEEDETAANQGND